MTWFLSAFTMSALLVVLAIAVELADGPDDWEDTE